MAASVVFMLVLTWGGNRFLWLSPTIIGDDRRLARARASPSSGMRGRADEPFLPLPLLSRQRRALCHPRRQLRARRDDGTHRATAAVLRGGLSPRPPARPGLALIPLAAISTCGAAICRPHHGAGEALQARRDHRRYHRRGLGRRARAGYICRSGACWCCCRCSRSASARHSRSPWSRSRTRWRAPQVGTVTGAMNFFRSLASSFTVAAFTAIL